MPRKSVEPIALVAGTAVRTLQEFSRDHVWEHGRPRDLLQQRVVQQDGPDGGDDLGCVGLIDETGKAKKGTKTPGVQRQWCGEVGKLENCIVTAHLGLVRGRFKTLLDADLFLPKGRSADRERCRQAGIPDYLVYRPKWRIALEQVDRARANGVVMDWLSFDEDYGKAPEFLQELDDRQMRYAGEVPKSFHCAVARGGPGRRASRADNLVRHSPAFFRQRWRRFRLHHQTTRASTWWLG